MRSYFAVPLVLTSALLFVTGCPAPQPQQPPGDGGVVHEDDAGLPPADAGEETDGGVVDAGTPTLSLLAGSTGGAGTLDGPRQSARFSAPVALARDSQGNLFVVDQTSCVIRKIDSAGVVTTFAGAPNSCGHADGPGHVARFASPVGIAIDAADHLYISDASNYVIRKITPAGVVSTFAGTPLSSDVVDGVGFAARFASPRGITIDGAGNLYVADEGAHAIRKITPAAEVTTLTGDPSEPGHADGALADARFNFVLGIVSDAAGNLWVTEDGVFSTEHFSSPQLIRHISAAGQVTTLAGDPASGPGNVDGVGTAARFDGLEGITRDADGNLYVVERNNNQVRKVTPSGEVTTLAGAPGDGGLSRDGVGTQARFGMPRGVLWVPNGAGVELFVADYAGSTIRHVDPQLNVTTWAGSTLQVGSTDGPAREARFWEATSIIPDGAGGYIVSDTLNHTLRRISADGTVSTWAGAAGEPGDADGDRTAARFNSPRGLARDAAGNLYVADSGNHTLRKIAPDGTVSLFAGGPGPRGGGDFIDGPRLDARFFTPVAITFDATGRMFVADATNNAIRMIDAAGQVTTIAGDGLPGFIDGAGGQARFSLPYAIAIDAAGNLFVVDAQNHAIRKVAFDGAEWTVTLFAGAGPDANEQPTPGDQDGVGAEARFRAPQSITLDTEGNLLVADMANHLIRKITPGGEVSTWAGQRARAGLTEGALPATLFEPLSVRALDSGEVLGTFSSGVFRIRGE